MDSLTRKRREIGFTSQVNVYVDLGNSHYARVPFDDGELAITGRPKRHDEAYVLFSLKPKLLRRILLGPQFAHWNNAEIGSHIRFYRSPDVFERGLYHSMCFFHA